MTLDRARVHASPRARAQAEAARCSYYVFATREGLVGGTTANGHVIAQRATASSRCRRAARCRANGQQRLLRASVCAPNGRCAFAPVWDVGPWNTKDDYWNPGREQWASDLPAGHPAGAGRVPQRLQRRQGRVRPRGRPTRPGIDLGRRHLLGRPRADQQLTVHGGLPVDGQRPAVQGQREGRPDPVRAAPDTDAAGRRHGGRRGRVPVQCRQGRRGRLGPDRAWPVPARLAGRVRARPTPRPAAARNRPPPGPARTPSSSRPRPPLPPPPPPWNRSPRLPVRRHGRRGHGSGAGHRRPGPGRSGLQPARAGAGGERDPPGGRQRVVHRARRQLGFARRPPRRHPWHHRAPAAVDSRSWPHRRAMDRGRAAAHAADRDLPGAGRHRGGDRRAARSRRGGRCSRWSSRSRW